MGLLNKFKKIIGTLPERQTPETESPDFCVIEVSHRCMFNCKMCNYGKSALDPEEIGLADLSKFISSLKKFVNGNFEMNISGGEPLLKDGILDLIEFIAAEGIRFSLVTNGYLINKTIAKRIADSGLNFLAISLDSPDEATHDYLRGMKGAYRKVMEAVDYFLAYRGKIQNLVLQTIIMGPNLERIPELVKWAATKQASLSFMAVTRPNMAPAAPAWYKKEEFSFLWPQDASKVHGIIDELIALKRSGHRIDNPIGQLERFKLYFSDPERFVRQTPCSLGEGMLHINPRGDVHSCCEMESIGNIRIEDISRIWVSEKAQGIRKRIKACKMNCAGMVNCYREAV